MRIESNLRHNVILSFSFYPFGQHQGSLAVTLHKGNAGSGDENVVFERFCVDSRKRIKIVVWTRIDRCVFDDNENAYFWKRISVNRA